MPDLPTLPLQATPKSAPAPALDQPPPMRRFGDHAAVRGAIFSNSLDAVKSLPAIENSRYRLDLSDFHYAGPESVSPAEQKKATLEGRTLARRLRGTVTLFDKTTNAPVETKTTTLAHVPILSDLGTFTLEGNARVLSHQLRLDPGAYVRRKGDGRVESHFPFLPGQGTPHRVHLDPESGVLKVEAGQAEIPALPLLRALGASDEELRHVLGHELFTANEKAAKPQHLAKLYEKLGPPGPRPESTGDQANALRQHLEQGKLDPWVVQRTLGVNADRYGKNVALAAVGKLIKVARGEAEPDDRDSLIYQSLWGPEHTIPERLARSGPLLKRLLWQATNKGSLAQLSPGLLTPAVKSVFLHSGLGQNPESINALELIDHGSRVTKVGEGGLGRSADAIAESARNVSPSHYLFLDPSRTSESESVGLDLRSSFGTQLGTNKKPYAPVRDVKTGKITLRNPRELADAVVAFPGPYNRGDKRVPAIVNGRLGYAHRDQVNYVAPSGEQQFSPLTNLVPLKSGSKPQRTSMGARYITQALPLVNRESPLVRTQVPGQPGKSFESLFGRHAGALHAHDQAGEVEAVSPAGITVRYADGKKVDHPLFDHHPIGRSTMLHQTPTVKPGDKVQPGQLLATSNYTDDAGHTAFGANARVGLVPYIRGGNITYEDSIGISESFANNKLRSEHLYKHNFTPDEHTVSGKAAYLAAFSGRHALDRLKNYDDAGVVKPGTQVESGEPLIMAVRNAHGGYGVLKGRRAGLTDASTTWDHDEPGHVIDVTDGKGGTKIVTVKVSKPFKYSDKLSGLAGNKGVAAIIPDHEMPTDESGQPLDAIFSSLGVTSRINAGGTLVAAALGKAAAARGEPYHVEDFGRIGHLAKFAKQELAKYGLKDKEQLTDPVTGRKTPPVSVGNLYLMKLSHTAEKKIKGRGIGAYDDAGSPLRGQSGQASRMSMGDTMALISSGASDVLRDIRMFRGQQNDDFWAAYMAGHPAGQPATSPKFERFLDLLRATGVNPVRRGSRIQLTALTRGDVDKLAGTREVKTADTVDMNTGKAVPGGLFDSAIFGAQDSPTAWAKIPLHEPYPNPAFEEPARRLLGLTEKQYRETIAGNHQLGSDTGPGAILNALKKINVPDALKEAREQVGGSRGTRRDDAVRRLEYLKGLERTGQTPADWAWHAIPVLPPAFRPVRAMAGGRAGAVISDPNLLYRDALEANHAYKALKGRVSDLSTERLAVYDAAKAVAGLGDPIQAKNVERGVRGVLREVFPGSAKHSLVSQRLLSSPADLSGRGQVMPNADLNMDQVGLPETLAWQTFSPFVIRRLVRGGVSRVEAMRAVQDRTDKARQGLLAEMGERVVTATRYPVLHRYGLMAFHPVLMAGDAVQTNPLVNKGLGLDHDGDTMTVHVPLTDDAQKDAREKLLPSNNLYSPANFKATNFLPNMEFVQGLYHASTASDDHPPRVFRSRREAAEAYARGEVNLGTPIEILEQGK